jgi:hypothetical protein
MARREHAAEGRQHDVEARGRERQVLGVAVDPVDLHAGLRRKPARRVEQLGRES